MPSRQLDFPIFDPKLERHVFEQLPDENAVALPRPPDSCSVIEDEEFIAVLVKLEAEILALEHGIFGRQPQQGFHAPGFLFHLAVEVDEIRREDGDTDEDSDDRHDDQDLDQREAGIPFPAGCAAEPSAR